MPIFILNTSSIINVTHNVCHWTEYRHIEVSAMHNIFSIIYRRGVIKLLKIYIELQAYTVI